MNIDLVHFLRREYPLATSFEIAEALNVVTRSVRKELGWHWELDDAAEYERRRNFTACRVSIRIMRRRLMERKERVAA